MTNPNDPAFPLPDRELGAPIGLTKREKFAESMMAAMVAGSRGLEISKETFARQAEVLADALIAQLNKK